LLPENIIDQHQEENPLTTNTFNKGEVRVILRDQNLNVLRDTGWQPNQVTYYGAQRAMYADGPGYIHISSSTATPQPDWTALPTVMSDAALGTTGAGIERGDHPSELNNWTTWSQYGARIYSGADTIRLIGMTQTGSNTNLMAACTLTTPVIKAADNIVDVYHRKYQKYDTSIKTGVVNFRGEDFNVRQTLARLERARSGWNGTGVYTSTTIYGWKYTLLSEVRYDDGTYNDGREVGYLYTDPSADGQSGDYPDYLDDEVLCSAAGPGSRGYQAVFEIQDANDVFDPANGGCTLVRWVIHGYLPSKPAVLVEYTKVSDGTSGLWKDETEQVTVGYTAQTNTWDGV
jgi:hypothetical protein